MSHSVAHLVALTWAVPELPAAASALGRIGFDVDPSAKLSVGEVDFEFLEADSPETGLRAWAFSGDRDEGVRFDPTTLPPTELRTRVSPPHPETHPNGVYKIDHVVAMVPRLETSVAGLEEHVGAECRRRGEVRGLPAAFLRAGEVVLEVIEMRNLDGPRLWGTAFTTGDCDKTVAVIRERGGKVTDPDRAIQGGRMAQCPGDVLGMTVAFLEPAR